MIYFAFSSSACNLSCTYCGGTPEDLEMPEKVQYDPQKLIDKIKQDDDPVVVFYGGEPLLSIPYIQQLIDSLPKATFVLQSNCTLLHLLPTTYLLKFACILCSIDGRPETVAKYRGPKIYNKVFKNLQDAKDRGFKGHVIARMACSMDTDIYEDVAHLMQHEVKFDSIYWQLDSQWDYPMNIRWGDFEGYLNSNYMPGIQKLFQLFIDSCRSCNGDYSEFIQINPFCQPLESMLKNTPTGLRCSAGQKALSVTTDGRFLCCPVASSEKWNNIGHLDKDEPINVMGKVKIGGLCMQCEDIKWCGGRCLYANQTMHWKEEGFKIVCSTVKQILRLCEGFLEELQGLIKENKVKMEWFEFPNERYSLETIP